MTKNNPNLTHQQNKVLFEEATEPPGSSELNFEKREAIACFNPKITYYGEQEVFMDEGCLSYPGLWLKVKRPYNIFVNYENVEGELIEEPMKDMEARIFQHEMDHMEGKDFTSHVSKLRMDMAKKRQQKQHKKIRRMVGQ